MMQQQQEQRVYIHSICSCLVLYIFCEHIFINIYICKHIYYVNKCVLYGEWSIWITHRCANARGGDHVLTVLAPMRTQRSRSCDDGGLCMCGMWCLWVCAQMPKPKPHHDRPKVRQVCVYVWHEFICVWMKFVSYRVGFI